MLIDKPVRLAARLLDVVENHVAPLTRAGVRKGDKIFGAAILRKSDGALVVAGTNEETECPLWHGEVVAIRRFHELRARERPGPEACLFLSTHEPCPLCLSAITWAGFDNFYYLFSYEDSRDDFDIPHDLQILEEVFGCAEGNYLPTNAYWRSHDIVKLIESFEGPEKHELRERVTRLKKLYAAMSETYQASKGAGKIPLA